VRVTVNGDAVDLEPMTTIEDVVVSLGIERRGVAVSLDREIVPRSSWATTTVTEGAHVEVLAAAAGG
jgi:sulfur carrier protein